MNKTLSRCFLTGALAAACAGPAFAGAPSPAQTPTPDPGAAAAASSLDNPLRYAVVEDTWIYLVDEPGIYLDHARADLRRRMFTQAATDVRKAAAMIDADAARAGVADRSRLQQDVGALLQVAAGIDAGRVTDGKRLDIAIAKARTDLAVHHEWNAAEAWARKDLRAAGRALAASARYAKSAMVSLGAKTSAQESDELLGVERFADRLARRAGNAAESDWTRFAPD